jgi:hypothetical protein
MTLAQILARLDKLEARLALPATVDRSLEQVMAQLNLIAERRREDPGWRPSGSRRHASRKAAQPRFT